MSPSDPADCPTHGCRACKAQQPYTVETLPNRNTLWRCAVCSHVVHRVPGTYSESEEFSSGEASA